MNNDFQPLQHYLKNVYKQLHVEDAVERVEVTDAYKAIVGDFINRLTTATRYENHCLYVTIASAALRKELSYKRQSLTEKINDRIGRPVLQNIVFT